MATGKTLYLHVGTHKTATTALQGFFARNAHLLGERVLYPAAGRANMGAHHHFFSSIRNPPHPDFPPRKSFDGYLEELREETRAAHRILMSSEILSEKIDTASLGKLGEIADRVAVILYLRPQHAYIVSLYNELVKNTQWVRPLSEAVGVIPADYYGLCERWSRSFGKENLLVKPFQRSRFVGGSVFSDFLSIFDLPLTDAYALPEGMTNPSLSRDEVEFKRWINFLPLSFSDLRKVRDRLSMYSVERKKEPAAQEPWLCAEERSAIMKKYEAGNARVAAEFLGREDGRLFADEPAGAEGSRAAYGGPSEDAVRGMAAFLRREDPELFREIAGALAREPGADPARAEAVRVLRPGFGEEAEKG